MYGFFDNPRKNVAFFCLDAAFIGSLLPSASFNRINTVILLLLLLFYFGRPAFPPINKEGTSKAEKTPVNFTLKYCRYHISKLRRF